MIDPEVRAILDGNLDAQSTYPDSPLIKKMLEETNRLNLKMTEEIREKMLDLEFFELERENNELDRDTSEKLQQETDKENETVRYIERLKQEEEKNLQTARTENEATSLKHKEEGQKEAERKFDFNTISKNWDTYQTGFKSALLEKLRGKIFKDKNGNDFTPDPEKFSSIKQPSPVDLIKIADLDKNVRNVEERAAQIDVRNDFVQQLKMLQQLATRGDELDFDNIKPSELLQNREAVYYIFESAKKEAENNSGFKAIDLIESALKAINPALSDLQQSQPNRYIRERQPAAGVPRTSKLEREMTDMEQYYYDRLVDVSDNKLNIRDTISKENKAEIELKGAFVNQAAIEIRASILKNEAKTDEQKAAIDNAASIYAAQIAPEPSKSTKMAEYYYDKLADLTAKYEGPLEATAVRNAANELKKSPNITSDQKAAIDNAVDRTIRELNALQSSNESKVATPHEPVGRVISVIEPIGPARKAYDPDEGTPHAMIINAFNSESILTNQLNKITNENKSVNKWQLGDKYSDQDVHYTRTNGNESEFFNFDLRTGKITTNVRSEKELDNILSVFKDAYPGHTPTISIDNPAYTDTLKKACESNGFDSNGIIQVHKIEDMKIPEERKLESASAAPPPPVVTPSPSQNMRPA